MNQILNNSFSKSDDFEESQILSKPSKLKHFLKLQFSLLSIALVIVMAYYVYFKYELSSSEKVSKQIMDNLKITKLYASDSDYNTENLNTEVVFYENSSFIVIGSIEIKKINISYPILSEMSKEALKIAPCKLYGPMPNQIR